MSHELGDRIPIEKAVNGSFKYMVRGDIYNKAMDRLYATRCFLAWYEPFEGVRDVLLQLAEEGYRIRVVSTARSLTEAMLQEWCMSHGLPVVEYVTGASDKTPYYLDTAAVIDDTPKHLKPLEGEDTRLILFRHENCAEGVVPDDLPFIYAKTWPALGNILCKAA